MGAQGAADQIGIGLRGAGAVEREPGCQRVGVTLISNGFHDVVAPQQWNGPPKRLKIIAAPAAGARVDQHAGMALDKFVPIGQIPFNMADFGNPLPVFRVVGPPERQRVNIEVLPVQVYALFGK